MDCRMPSFPVLHNLLELAQTHVHWVSDTIQPSHPLSSPSPLAFHLSQDQGLFQWVCYTKKILKFLTHTHTQSLRVVPGRGLKSHPTQAKGRALRVLHSQHVLLCKTILLPSWWGKRLLQNHSSKASILLCLAFFIVRLLHSYITTGKTIALTRWTFLEK